MRKETKGKIIFFMILLIVLILASGVLAASHLPLGLLKIEEENARLAQEFLENISFFIAFLAGMTSLLSPCLLPLWPAYFAITFKEKKRITLSTFIFFLGFALIFILMGLLATLTGKTLISVFKGINWLVPAIGILLILFGLMTILGKGFSGLIAPKKFRDDPVGIFLTGIFFAVGWTACIGPILSGVLLMSSVFRNYFTASYLMLGYSLGLFVPLFILSFFYDKVHLEKLRWLQKKIKVKIKNKEYHLGLPNIIAGTLFILLGLVFFIFRGTSIFNRLQLFGLRQYFYDGQRLFLANIKVFNFVGMAVFIVFILVLGYFLIREIRNKKGV